MAWTQFWQVFTAVLYWINIIIAITASIILISKRQDPVKTMSWVLVMLLLPYIGITLYFFVGRNFRKEKMFSRKGVQDLKLRKELCKEMEKEFEEKDKLPEEVKPFHKLIIQNLRSAKSLLLQNDDIQVYFSGKESLSAMAEAMKGAKQHIHLQSYILEDDKVGNYFKDIMIEKAKEGVEVRLMYDGFGSRKLSKKFLSQLSDAGVELLDFSPFKLFFLPPLVNYRNHRKILVVDSTIGFLGGVNIADRYFDGGSFPEWRDTHIKVTGDSVISLQASFLLDRFFILNRNIKHRGRYYPHLELGKGYVSPLEGKYFTQVISSGPDSDWAAIMQCYFTAITNAKHNIYIITPYFIPSETILDAVKISALSGVDVSLMIPERSDTWLANWGTRSYISELLEAGVHIYLFERGFNHSKVLSIDGEYCIIGSANMDNRSLEHHFEVTSVIYDSRIANIIEERFAKDLYRCKKLNYTSWHKRSRKNKFNESVARLLSPML